MAATSLAGCVVFVLGCAVGSFLNVVRYRLPRKLNLVSDRSRCPSCQKVIAWYDNIPVASFLILRRRCRSCGWPIPWTYFVIELATGAIFLASWLTFPLVQLPAYLVLASLLVACAGTDYDLRIIPDVLTLPGLVVGIAFSVTILRSGSLGGALARSLAGACAGGGSLLAVGLAYRLVRKLEGMGGGDVKLMAMVGAFLGWKLALLAIFLGALGGGLVGLAVAGRSSRGMKTALPFGVFLSPAAIVAMLWGDRLIAEYVRLVTR